MFSPLFDISIAKKVGVDAAIVLQYITTLSNASVLNGGDKQVRCTDTLLLTTFAWLKKADLADVTSRLLEKKLIAIDENDSTLITPVAKSQAVRELREERAKAKESKAKISVYDKVITYTRREQTGDREVSVTVDTLVNELIQMFGTLGITPNSDMFYSSRAQRNAAAELFNKYEPQFLFDTMYILPKTNTIKYAPVILSPQDMLHKLPNLLVFAERAKEDGVDLVV